jgi:hypothetical protein
MFETKRKTDTKKAEAKPVEVKKSESKKNATATKPVSKSKK